MKSQDSFEKLVEDYTPMIYHIINKLHIYKDFEHYFQLGLIALWETTKKYDEKQGKFSSFAYSTIKGKILDELKKESSYFNRVILSDSYVEIELVDENCEIAFEKEILLSYCSGLSKKQIRWVMATFIDDKSMSEIAKDEGVSKMAVSKWKKDALCQMKKNIMKKTL